jgi:SIR2-like protein
MTENEWDTILEKIRIGYCTPFIGAGASRPLLPGGAEFAEELLKQEEAQSGKPCPLLDRSDLARVAQYLAVTHEDAVVPRSRIAKRIAEAGAPDFNDPNEPHALLADLRLPIYITTNYDDFMTRALTSRNRACKREICRWNRQLLEEQSSEFDGGFDPRPEEPVVFHLHGHTGVWNSMVASEDDYLDFLVNISKDLSNSPTVGQRTMLPLRIRRAIRNSTLLFVGYGLADINFRVILRGLVGSLEPSGRQVHLTVQYPDGGEGANELRQYLEKYFRWTLDLKVFWGSSREFTDELRRRWKAKS